ncbi:hypothetical protein T492DRAFT_543320 [Pavlovales sp. CCMP2436]|nr:hypothetical protein T492DRAFT_543320 [Pavlovales sp. CCMP2436]
MIRLRPLPLALVSLTAGTRWARAQDANFEYLNALHTDALLWSWRNLAKSTRKGLSR